MRHTDRLGPDIRSGPVPAVALGLGASLRLRVLGRLVATGPVRTGLLDNLLHHLLCRLGGGPEQLLEALHFYSALHTPHI